MAFRALLLLSLLLLLHACGSPVAPKAAIPLASAEQSAILRQVMSVGDTACLADVTGDPRAEPFPPYSLFLPGDSRRRLDADDPRYRAMAAAYQRAVARAPSPVSLAALGGKPGCSAPMTYTTPVIDGDTAFVSMTRSDGSAFWVLARTDGGWKTAAYYASYSGPII